MFDSIIMFINSCHLGILDISTSIKVDNAQFLERWLIFSGPVSWEHDVSCEPF